MSNKLFERKEKLQIPVDHDHQLENIRSCFSSFYLLFFSFFKVIKDVCCIIILQWEKNSSESSLNAHNYKDIWQ